MKTQVVIIWDKPEDKHWLNAENIKTALSNYCKNTNFEVEELKSIHSECKPLEELLEKLALLVDKAENYLALIQAPMLPSMKIDAMKNGLEEIRNEAKECYLKNGGENVWE